MSEIDYGYGFMTCEREEATEFLCGCDKVSGWSKMYSIIKCACPITFRKPVTHGPDGKPWAESEWEMVPEYELDTIPPHDEWKCFRLGKWQSWLLSNWSKQTARAWINEHQFTCYARKKSVKEKQIDCPPLVASYPPPMCVLCDARHDFGTPCLEAERLALVNESNGLQLRVAELEERNEQLETRINRAHETLASVTKERDELKSSPQWPAPVTDRLPDCKYVFAFEEPLGIWINKLAQYVQLGEPWLPQPPEPVPQNSEAEIAWENLPASEACRYTKAGWIAGFNAATKGGVK